MSYLNATGIALSCAAVGACVTARCQYSWKLVIMKVRTQSVRRS
jgi:hypothetical protein